jgi:hypothetical protein
MPTTIRSNKDAKANVAVSQALGVGADPKSLEIARQYLGTSKFIGYCQRFVRQVTGGRTIGASAIEAWNKAPQKIQGVQGIQPGDPVYFSPNSSNRGYGHTGIYAGNGQFVSATDRGIRQANLGEWIKATGQKLLGYVPGANRALGLGGQQESQQTQNLAYTPPTPEQGISHSIKLRQSGIKSPIPMPSPSSTINLDPNSNLEA